MKRIILFGLIAVSTAACEVEVGNGLCADSLPLSLRPRPPRPCKAVEQVEYDERVLQTAEKNGVERERAKQLVRLAESAGY